MVESETFEAEKKLIDDLGAFILEVQIPKIIKDLQGIENAPNDHESLTQLVHSHGVNMRYLGKIHECLKTENCEHMATIVERDILLRCLKHVFNEKLRECAVTDLIEGVTFLLNCVFSSEVTLAALNEGNIKPSTPSMPHVSTTTELETNQRTKKNKKKN
jgi:protein TIF31